MLVVPFWPVSSILPGRLFLSKGMASGVFCGCILTSKWVLSTVLAGGKIYFYHYPFIIIKMLWKWGKAYNNLFSIKKCCFVNEKRSETTLVFWRIVDVWKEMTLIDLGIVGSKKKLPSFYQKWKHKWEGLFSFPPSLNPVCCIFRPAFGCCALQTLDKKFAANFSKKQFFLISSKRWLAILLPKKWAFSSKKQVFT